MTNLSFLLHSWLKNTSLICTRFTRQLNFQSYLACLLLWLPPKIYKAYSPSLLKWVPYLK